MTLVGEDVPELVLQRAATPKRHPATPQARQRSETPMVLKKRRAIIAAGVGEIHHLNFSSQFYMDTRMVIETNSPEGLPAPRGNRRETAFPALYFP